MARIEKLEVGDTVVEMLGPHTGRNYFSTTHVPELHVQMFGAGSVQYQVNVVWMFRGERSNSASNQIPINFERVPDPSGSNWTDIGGVVSPGAIVDITVPAQPEINFIRAIVVTTGDGSLATVTHWD